MFNRSKKEVEESPYDSVKNALLETMSSCHPNSDEYVTALKTYHIVLAQESALPPKAKTGFMNKLDPNTLFLVAGNLLGILVIVAYEQKHVFASQASKFIQKVK